MVLLNHAGPPPMAFKHLTLHLLEELLDVRETPSHELLLRLLMHVIELCPECRLEYDLAAEALQLRYRDRYSEEAAMIVARMLKLGVNFTRLRSEADEEHRRLLLLEPSERTVRISRALSRYRSPFLVDTLLSHSRGLLTTDPHEAYEWAESAHAVALRVPQDLFGASWAMTSLALAKAHRGNALRVQGEYLRASPLLEAALALFKSEGDGDPLVMAEIVALLATLRMDQRRHVEAERLLDRAERLYIEVDDPVLRAKILLKRAHLYAEMGRGGEAIAFTKDAMQTFAAKEERRLYLLAVQHLGHFLRDAGRFEEARDVLTAHTEYYQALIEPLLNLRLAWLSSTIAHGLGQLTEAASSLAAVRERFLVEGLAYDAALAGLDLALVLLDQGETAEIQRLAEEIVPVFLAQDVGREAIATLMLFQEAARQQRVTRELLRDLWTSLRRHRC